MRGWANVPTPLFYLILREGVNASILCGCKEGVDKQSSVVPTSLCRMFFNLQTMIEFIA